MSAVHLWQERCSAFGWARNHNWVQKKGGTHLCFKLAASTKDRALAQEPCRWFPPPVQLLSRMTISP